MRLSTRPDSPKTGLFNILETTLSIVRLLVSTLAYRDLVDSEAKNSLIEVYPLNLIIKLMKTNANIITADH
jgi:hypothetical protein